MIRKMRLYTTDGKYIREASASDAKSGYTGMIEYSSGMKAWYVDGFYHRVGGPAVIWVDGTNQWFINRNEVAKEYHDLLYNLMTLKGLM